MTSSGRQDTSTTAIGNLALAGVNALGGVLLARLLGPSGRGELAAIQLWGFLFATVALLGVPEAVVYRVARRRNEAGSEVISASALTLVSSLLWIGVGYAVIPVVLDSQSDDVQRLARVFLLVAPLYALLLVPTQALRGLGDFRRWNVLRILPSALWLGVIVVSWGIGRTDPGFVMVGYLIVNALAYGFALLVAAKRVRPPYRLETWRWSPLLRFGLPVALTSVPQTLNLRLDQLLLAAFVPARELGLYVAAVAWSGVVALVVTPLGLVLFPRLAGEADLSKREELLIRGIRVSVALDLIVTVGALLLTPVAMRVLFGGAFVEAVPAAAVLIVAGGLLAFNLVLEECFRGLGRPGLVLQAEIVGLAATAGLLAALLGPFGIMGAAVASVVGYAGTMATLLWQLPAAAGTLARVQLLPGRADLQDLRTAIAGLVRRDPD